MACVGNYSFQFKIIVKRHYLVIYKCWILGNKIYIYLRTNKKIVLYILRHVYFLSTTIIITTNS